MAKGDKIDDKVDQDVPQQRRLRFTEEGVKTLYSGIFNVGLGAEEVILMFGNPSIDPNVMRIESKIAVSLKNAKRITLSLGNLIRRYEAVNGVIDISPSKTEKGGKNEEKPIQ
ncbi:MAG: DUF3467 domain-containing protein [Smithella sp.]